MILVRTPESRYFEEAHLVLRTERCLNEGEDGDMLREANRIIEEAGLCSEPPKKRRGSVFGIGAILLGSLFGGGAVGAVWLLCTLL